MYDMVDLVLIAFQGKTDGLPFEASLWHFTVATGVVLVILVAQ